MGYIYKITNKVNNKIYIGQTRQAILGRWRDHVSAAYHQEREFPLHKAIIKYGEDSFIIEQIESCNDNTLNEREIYWINYYNSYNDGYNASLGGLGHSKYDYDAIVEYFLTHNYKIQETCTYFHCWDQVVYNALISRKIDYKSLTSNNSNIKTIKVKQYNLATKELMGTFNSIREAGESISKEDSNKIKSNIQACCSKRTKSAYGFYWEYCEKSKKFNIKNVTTGKIYSTISEAAKDIGKPDGGGNISRVLKGIRKTAYGSEWIYLEED